MKLWFFLLLSLGVAAQNVAPPLSLPGYAEGTYTIKDFHFRSGEVLPELHLSYVTVGTPLRDASGQVRNAMLMLHGTGGDHRFPFLQPGFVSSLYGVDEPLDLRKYYLILPDCLGHGKSSKPSDGLRVHFPKYRYEDMVLAEYRLVTEGSRYPPPPADYRRLHGWHAHMALGRALSRDDGWLAPDGFLSGRDRWPEPPLEENHH
jgi:hypothetical protein